MSIQEQINVLLIEDDPMVQEVNKQFIQNVDGFHVIDTASDGVEGIRKIKKYKPELVILDIYMPKADGMELIYQIRHQKEEVDVIVITAANDRKTIRTMLQNGAIDYIIKPFKFDRIRQSLNNFRNYKRKLSDGSISQHQLDQMLFSKEHHPPFAEDAAETELPKGLNKSTLDLIEQFLLNQSSSKSAEEVAEGVGVARVTSRRYLEYLKEAGKIHLDVQYGGVGRPVNRYIMSKIK
ncbi:response regulator [Chengkuizengella axinellae]|uniref:Transcriptional regulatory protein n=1 Tax=Chengkuizengella axinellae TaxID=3064388 RepID=A0ABT9J4E6_9BACL|nr:response regulator [Chengkuizengella sp. 2205SS18-9]MDP5276506.1 response regulator [Chengkuizengella sp. 2205SS18-9]